jgi:hypothetical protein
LSLVEQAKLVTGKDNRAVAAGKVAAAVEMEMRRQLSTKRAGAETGIRSCQKYSNGEKGQRAEAEERRL